MYGIATSASVGTGGSNSAALVKHTHTFSGTKTTLKPTASYTPAGSVNFAHMHIYNSAYELPVLLKGTGKQILANSTSGASTRLWGVDNSKTYSSSFSVAHTGAAIDDGSKLSSTITSRSITGTAATINSSVNYTPEGSNAETGTLAESNTGNMPAYQSCYI